MHGETVKLEIGEVSNGALSVTGQLSKEYAQKFRSN
jgi:hypothetical protein